MSQSTLFQREEPSTAAIGNLSIGGKLQEVGASFSSIDLTKGNNNAKAAIETVCKNTEQAQGKGDFELLDELFAEILSGDQLSQGTLNNMLKRRSASSL